ncbi:sugar ABC transporter ATP-binding protein (plasmid) [Ensifer adhaerens]|uniref:Sugar ABC transporter ATP-binding protein n=1 Tax=Ensifer adhaerens TaxID=106592 RepID=A0ABY8HR91_ENSAD|nr:sugar ABC transporter ATP-binding protein [Ensifer adhaerens]ANK77359.1 sugar ABC transporter ATP-binding protein [Ensifer adhaerens]KDP74260.1 sugar ABC transporter ATPase [Ensifer adhaerens]WFP94622.1 sugar ABC transporter ATP-binding protein [Ensifer adhaerens]
MNTKHPAIEMRGIAKSFPGVKALKNVSFSAHCGEVHALAGENGAGKSTLMKILSGIYRPDAGAVVVNGEERHFTHPLAAIRAGIAVIYQEFSLLPERTVAQNIFLGREPTRRGLIDHRAMNDEARRVLALFGSAHRIEPSTVVADLDVASQQLVEIAKAVSLEAKVIVMDEPTAALNEAECEVLYGLVDTLKKSGVAIVYITHRMPEITRLADRVTVLKDGEVAVRFDHVPEPEAIVRAMVGRDLGDFYAEPAAPQEIGGVVLSVRNAGNERLKNVSFELRAGEIVGFSGLQGAGRVALAQAIFGLSPFTKGEITLSGKPARFTSPREAISAGVGLLPGDRKAEALVLMQSVVDNGMLTSRALSGLSGNANATPFVSAEAMEKLLRELDVRAGSFAQDIKALSGGNQQKAIVARWLALAPRLLIFIEPTRGIDVNAKAGIYHLMRDLARRGTAIMMVSSDLPEVLGVSDRILVMRNGELVAAFSRGASEADVMLAATGEEAVAA